MTAPRSDMRNTAAAAAVLGLFVVALVVAMLLHERNVELARAETSARAMTLVMDAHTESTFHAVSLMLSSVVDAYRARAPADDDPSFRALLRQRLRELPYVRAIYIIGRDGYVRHDTDHPDTPRVSLADRDYFQQYVHDPTLQEAIAPPTLSRSGLGWFNPVTHRIVHDGRFEGVAVAAVIPTYFEALYRRMELGAGQTIELFYTDLTRVARYPADDETLGRKATPEEVFGKASNDAAPAGTTIARQGWLRARMTSYRQLERAPFIVTFTQSPPSLLAAWRSQLFGAMLALGALAGLLAALVVQLGRKQQLARRAQARITQSERLEAIGQLTGGIAHDFANLLGIVRTNLAILERLHPSDAHVHRAVETSMRAVANANRLIEQLLVFARRGELDVREIDVNQALRAHEAMLRQAAGGAAHVEFVLGESVGSCLADEAQLVVALVNLVVNARDAMHAADRRGTITVQTERVTPAQALEWELDPARSYLRLSVVDTGTGMDETVLRRVFEPFFTTKGSEGTGLGLAQVYGFLHQLGGDVRIDTTPGRGTVVHLFFPAVGARGGVQPVATTPSATSESISSSR